MVVIVKFRGNVEEFEYKERLTLIAIHSDIDIIHITQIHYWAYLNFSFCSPLTPLSKTEDRNTLAAKYPVTQNESHQASEASKQNASNRTTTQPSRKGVPCL